MDRDISSFSLLFLFLFENENQMNGVEESIWPLIFLFTLHGVTAFSHYFEVMLIKRR